MRTLRLRNRLAIVAALTAVIGTALAASAAHDTVTYISGQRTSEAFGKGQPLVETSGYKVHASRRETPGLAEIHTLDTDIIYVLDGKATIVTGGKTVGTRNIGPDEIRGSAIEGGVSQSLAKGDVFIVPAGVPHWFTEVTAPFLYYVVKVTTNAGGSR